MRMCRLVLIVAMLANVTACGASSPSSPDSPQPVGGLRLPPGSYWLDLTGFGVSSIPEVPPCEHPFLINGRTGARLSVELSSDGAGWVARSSPGTGDVELQVWQTGTSIGGFDVAGRLTGSGADLLSVLPASARGQVVIRGAGTQWAVLEGLGERVATFLRGTASGDIRFVNNDATQVSRCTVVLWSLQRKTTQS
jgi:hypothetical protein